MTLWQNWHHSTAVILHLQLLRCGLQALNDEPETGYTAYFHFYASSISWRMFSDQQLHISSLVTRRTDWSLYLVQWRFGKRRFVLIAFNQIRQSLRLWKEKWNVRGCANLPFANPRYNTQEEEEECFSGVNELFFKLTINAGVERTPFDT